MELNGGLWLDSTETNQPKGTWRYLLNGVFDVDRNVITDEDGFRKFSKNLPTGDCVGSIILDEEIILFFEGTNEIGTLDKNGYYTRVVSSSLFNFDSDYPIKAKTLKNFNLERIVTFVDEHNEPKIVNLDNLVYTLNSSRVITGTSDLNSYFLFPEFTEPKITNTSVESGGGLKSGTYYVIFQYETEYGGLTSFSKQSIPFYVSATSDVRIFGSDSNQSSSRRIKFDIQNIDTRFSKLRIGLVQEIEGQVSAVLSKILAISGTTITAESIVNNAGSTLTLEETLVNPTNYVRIKDIELTEDEFLGANVVEDDQIDFQRYANMIRINYSASYPEVKIADRGVTEEAQQDGNDKGFRTGEVYAFYCSLVLTKGGETRLFHIPGRAPIGTEATDISSYADGQTNDEGGLPTGTLKYLVENDPDVGGAATNMSFFQNVTEEYPNTDEYNSTGLGGLDLRGQKVRHHKFPDLRALRSGAGTPSLFGVNIGVKLGIIASNIIIPSEIVPRIKGIKIYYAKRDIENATCLGQSLFQYNHADSNTTQFPSADITTFEPAIGNFKNRNSADSLLPIEGALRFYDFALMQSQPQISPSYISNQIEIRKIDIYQSNLTDGNTDGVRIGPAPAEYKMYSGNFTRSIAPISTTCVAIQVKDYIRRVNSYKYIPGNVNVGDSENLGGEEHIDIKYYVKPGVGNRLTINATALAANNFIDNGTTRLDEYTFITDLKQTIGDVYFGFDQSKDVVCTSSDTQGNYFDISAAGTFSTGVLFNGDNFLDVHSIRRTGIKDLNTIPTVDPNDPTAHLPAGLMSFKYFFHESIQHVRFRYEGVESKDRYFPVTLGITGMFWTLNVYDVQDIFYSNDFSQNNDNDVLLIYNTEDEFTNRHPFRVIRSNKIGREDENLALIFAPLSFYEMPKKRGEIVGLNAIRDKLVIRHQQGTYVTRPKQKLTTDAGDATIGTNDLFDIEPEEIFTTDEGFIKSRGVFDAISIENGLVIVDFQEGKIFLVGGSVKELTEKESGVSDFLLEEMQSIQTYERKFVYLTANTTISTYSGNRWQIAFNAGLVNSFDFKKGEYIYLNTEATFCKILKSYTNASLQVILETDYDDATVVQQTITHFRRIDSPFYNNGVIMGWDKGNYNLFFTFKNKSAIPKSSQNRFVGKLINNTNFTSDLNTGDIVQNLNNFQTWNGSSFDANIVSENRDFTISYNFNKNKWISFHTYIPNIYMYQKDLLLSYIDGTHEIFRHNQENRKGQYYSDTRQEFRVDVVFNYGNKYTKKFYNVKWVVNFLSSAGVLDNTQTFNTIQCRNSYDDLGEVTLTPFVNLGARGNTRNIKGTWSFNRLKNTDNDLLSDKYLLAIFKDSDENSLYLYDMSSSFHLQDKNE